MPNRTIVPFGMFFLLILKSEKQSGTRQYMPDRKITNPACILGSFSEKLKDSSLKVSCQITKGANPA